MTKKIFTLLLCFLLRPWATAATTVRSSSTNTATTGTALSVAAPAGTTTGDVVLVVIHVNDTSVSTTDNNGATPFTADLDDFSFGAATGFLSVYSRRIQGGDPSTYNFTAGGSSRWTVHAITFQNPHASNIYDVAPTSGRCSTGTGTAGSAPSITTVTDGAIHVAMLGVDTLSATISATPSGYTVERNSGFQVLAFTDKVITSAGATGAQSFTNTNAAWGGCSFAVQDIGSVAATDSSMPLLGM